MKTRMADHRMAVLRCAAAVILAVICFAGRPRACGAEIWGRLANRSFDGQRIKTTFFFAGQANDGTTRPSDICVVPSNLDKYTLNPVPSEIHQIWTPAHRETVLKMMIDAGINVITMSSWGEDFLPCTDGWASGAAPMQTSPQAHNELFESVVNKPIFIMPMIESRFDKWYLRDEFPGLSDGRISPGLVSQIVNLVHRYLQNPTHPEWANVWAKVHDHSGAPRYAVAMIHVCSDVLGPLDDHQFAGGFDLVANEVAKATGGIQVGFFIDAMPRDSTFRARFKPSSFPTGIHLSKSASLLGIQCFAPEVFTGEHGDDDLLAWKRNFIEGWVRVGIPTLVDVSPGYDGSKVFGNHGKAPYGHSVEWFNGMTAIVNEFGRAGMVYNSWNGYTEAMVGTPTREKGNMLYDWLKSLNPIPPIHVDHNFSAIGKGTASEPFRSVAIANAEVADGDILRIRKGNYPEAITFTKRLTLQTENGLVTLGSR